MRMREVLRMTFCVAALSVFYSPSYAKDWESGGALGDGDFVYSDYANYSYVALKEGDVHNIVSAGPKAYSFRRNWVYSLA